jgi:hypothetical protein
MEDLRLRVFENKMLRRINLFLFERDVKNCIMKSFTIFTLDTNASGVSMQRACNTNEKGEKLIEHFSVETGKKEGHLGGLY